MSDLMLDLGKVLFATFVLGPFLVTDRPIKLLLVAAGILCSTVAMCSGLILSRPKEGE